jgi:hypothetical protein
MRFQGPLYYLVNLIRTEIIKMRSGLVPSLNIINMETNRVSQLDETGSGYIFQQHASATKSRYPPIQKKEKGQASGL